MAETGRADLTKRTIPYMVLGTGEPGTLSAAPPPANHIHPAENARERFSVKGNAIVTGGLGTLGLAACHALLEHGLGGVAIFDLNAAESDPNLAALRSRFTSANILVCCVDVTDAKAVAAAVDLAASQLGSIDHLLCFSGIVGCYNALDMSESQWRRVLDVNLTGSFLCAQAAARKMVAQGTGGSIIFTASISAHRVNFPQPQVSYNVSKAALLTLKNSLAAEWRGFGIRTNTISPGYMDTILNEGDGIADARRTWAERNPTGRMGVPSELTGAVVMLSSASSSYINGCDIVVDGGGVVF